MQRALAIAVILSVMLPVYPRSIRNRVISKVSLEHLIESADVIAQVRIVAVDEEIAYPPLARARAKRRLREPSLTTFWSWTHGASAKSEQCFWYFWTMRIIL